jgi:hypothetical protein
MPRKDIEGASFKIPKKGKKEEGAPEGPGYGRILLLLLFAAGLFFLKAFILMVTWNYVVPRFAESADVSYVASEKFQDIEYTTAMVAVFFVAVLFPTAYMPVGSVSA